MLIGTNSYRFLQHYQAQGQELWDHLDEALDAAAHAGLDAWEQAMLPNDAIARRLGDLLHTHGLRMPSMYVGCRLHDDTWAASIDEAIRQAARGIGLGAQLVIVNPDPIAWGTTEDKSDRQLDLQAEHLLTLCQRMRAEGGKIVLHFHAPEFRQGAREAYHMLLSVPADLLGLCLDVHWTYRGCGNSNVAVRNWLRQFGDRIAVVHLRQSSGGMWAETLGEGDVDYSPVASALRATRFDGPFQIELAVEPGTPITMSLEESHRRSAAWVRETFGPVSN